MAEEWHPEQHNDIMDADNPWSLPHGQALAACEKAAYHREAYLDALKEAIKLEKQALAAASDGKVSLLAQEVIKASLRVMEAELSKTNAVMRADGPTYSVEGSFPRPAAFGDGRVR